MNGNCNKSMKEALMECKKEELLEIGRLTEIKLAASWTKGKLAEEIAEGYKTNPERIVKTVSKDTVSILEQAFAQECVFDCTKAFDTKVTAKVAHQLRGLGLAFVEDADSTKIYVPCELKDLLADYINTAEVKAMIDEYDRYEQAVLGMFNYYGVIEIRDLHALFCKAMGQMEDEEFFRFVRQRHALTLTVYPLIDEEGDRLFLYNAKMSNPNLIVNEQLSRAGLGYKVYHIDEYLAAGAVGYIEKPEGYEKVAAILANKGVAEVEARLEAFNFQVKNEEKQQEIVDALLEGVNFDHQEEAQGFFDELQVYVNHLSLWVLKGNAPVDLSNRTVVNGPKVGRNDACPCGSGKKYKKCCGK